MKERQTKERYPLHQRNDSEHLDRDLFQNRSQLDSRSTQSPCPPPASSITFLWLSLSQDFPGMFHIAFDFLRISWKLQELSLYKSNDMPPMNKAGQRERRHHPSIHRFPPISNRRRKAKWRQGLNRQRCVILQRKPRIYLYVFLSFVNPSDVLGGSFAETIEDEDEWIPGTLVLLFTGAVYRHLRVALKESLVLFLHWFITFSKELKRVV